MKEIKFTNLQIKNFRNINELNVNFGDNQTIFKGQNKLGKTNILHSIIWCLFGKNIYNEKQFTISPIIDNVEDNTITTNVKLTINGQYVISRTYYNRTTKVEVGFIDVDGKENLVSMTQTQYLQDLKEKYVDEETFKSLSNIEYITNMNWKDLKKLIFELIGGISDDEVLLREDFSMIEELIRNFGIEKTIEQVSKTDKELNEEIKRLETEYQTTLNMKEKYVASNEDSENLVTRKKEIETILAKTKEEEEKNNKLRQQEISLRNEIDAKKLQINRLTNDVEFTKNNILEYQRLYDSSANSVDELRQKDINHINLKIKDTEEDLKRNQEQISKAEKLIATIQNKGVELKGKEVKIEDSTCPTCKQTLPEDMIQESLNKAKQQKQEELLNLKSQYESEKKYKISLDEEQLKLLNMMREFTKELSEVETKEYVIQESERQKQLRVAKETKELELKEMESSLETIKSDVIVLEKQYEELEKPTYGSDDNMPLILELDDINTKLATTTTLSKLEEDLQVIKSNLDNKKDNKIKNKEKQQQCVKFNNIKAELLKQKVSNYFKLVNFRTKEFTNDGQEVETFKITNNNNVEFKEMSKGEQMGAGLELLNVIQEFKQIKLPIILDELTVYSGKIDSNSQVIGTIMDRNIKEIEIETK